ncbi:LacI family DNA-binding transcriptional regulator [Bifidobacterium oedipodis]|uniref:LacI family transcriptional regulator n=1 Tax=Bifidobacterium oedipodis TaxID=2675322 RepID=A0A7Y0EQJ0_9BIFI|nr:substrate-binding domain-containing protein [Bifidobacterium sp. DSM 109957]NMM94537.1 LacI family transcriptional regulator [Bifidobacterium sp. DSM 109957]
MGNTDTRARKAKLAEIAAEAGVSVATVSKVINGRSGVAEQTRTTIERLLSTHGYSKSLASTKTSRTIEFVIASLENNGSFELAKELVYQARDFSVGITVTRLDGPQDTDECFRDIIDRNPMGVITLLSTMPQRGAELLKSRNIPYVTINSYGQISDDLLGIDIDNWCGGFDATQHLITLGHTRIGAITGPTDRQSSTARLSGYEAALGKAGLTCDPQLVAEGDYTSEAGYRAAIQLLELDEPPTAIFCFDDLMAVSLYKAAQERGISIPDDLSVIGFDDTYPSPYLSPALTTVRQPFDLIARKALKMVCESRDDTLEDRYIILPTHIVQRESTSSPRQQ